MTYSRPIRRRRRLRERAGFRAAFAILASLLGNALLVALLSWAGAFDVPRAPAVARPVALAPLSAKDWAANRAIAPGQRPPPRAPAPAQPAPPSPLQGQIVELPPGAADANPKPPRESRYLSDRDRTVEKETVSRYAGNQQNLAEKPQAPSPGSAAAGAGGRPAPPAPKAPPRETARAEARPQPPAPEASPTPKPSPPQRAEPERPAPERKEGSDDGRLALAPKLDETGRSPAPRRAEPSRSPPAQTPGAEERGAEPRSPAPPSPTPTPSPEEGVARAPGPQRPDLSVSPDTVARLGGGPGMAGYNEAEEGDITALNTRDGGATARWGMRLQRQIGGEWDRLVMRAVRERDPGGDIFFYKERSVVLTVVLDPTGNLRDVSVLRSSNIEFFDEAAVAAVRKAQPFEPPPSTFVVAGGTARFPFKFVLFPARRSVFSIGQPERY